MRLPRCIILVVLAAAADSAEAIDLGVTVQNGQFVRNSSPYYAVGVNYMDCMTRTLRDPSNTSYDDGFAALAAHNIPFARFNASGFWPADWNAWPNGYLTDKTAYFQAFDAVVASAERHHIGLIPSLFFFYATPPDLAGDHIGLGWGDPDSNTYTLMRQYISDVVGRYKNSPAIWGWELGNEYNLNKDIGELPPVGAWQGVWSRTSDDLFTDAEHQTAMLQFASAVRAIDPKRFISSGNSIPREAAYHLANPGPWDLDTLSQFNYMLAWENSPMDTTAIHLYDVNVGGRGAGVATTYSGLLGQVASAAEAQGKPVFLGEFGLDSTNYSADQRAVVQAQMDAIEANHIQLSCLWVYDHYASDGYCNITPTNERAYMLDMIGDYNRQLGVVMPEPCSLTTTFMALLIVAAWGLATRYCRG